MLEEGKERCIYEKILTIVILTSFFQSQKLRLRGDGTHMLSRWVKT